MFATAERQEKASYVIKLKKYECVFFFLKGKWLSYCLPLLTVLYAVCLAVCLATDP